MTETEISKYADRSTKEFSALEFKNGAKVVGHFIHTENKLRDKNKWNFILARNAEIYRDTTDEKFIEIIIGNDLLKIIHPNN